MDIENKDKDKNKPNNFVKGAGKVIDKAAGITFGAFGTVAKVIGTIFLIILTTGVLFTAIFAYYVKTCLTDSLDVSLSDYSLAESSIVYYKDNDGNWQELVTLKDAENRIWADYDDIPQYMKDAIVAIEDKRFHKHKGVDWYRTTGAFFNMFLTMKDDFGGSTLTQQLIKNLTGKSDATVQRKLLEIFRALEFEKNYDKKEILEWYLNAVFFGEDCYGVNAAAKTYFGKELKDLTLAECASIVGITNWPSRYDPFISEKQNKARQEIVLREMYEQGMISFAEYDEAKNQPLVFVRSEGVQTEGEIYSWYVEAVIKDITNDLMIRKGIDRPSAIKLLYNGGYRIYTLYNPWVQGIIDGVYKNLDEIPKPYRPSKTQQLQSAIVVMDPYTGNILGMAGGVGEKNANLLLNRACDTVRPPGSSIKPIAVYGPALEYGLITQETFVKDAGPDEIQLSGTGWYPGNAGGNYRGVVRIRDGLRLSLNTVSAQVLDKLGTSNSYDYLVNKLGVKSLVPDDNAYAPLSLGQLTYGMSVREITQAYCSFVNDGIFTYARTYERVTDSDGNLILDNAPRSHVAWKANTAYNMCNMLTNAVNYGTGSEARIPGMTVGGKTGTTSFNWDRWFVGITPYFVAGVWTGYDINENMAVYGNPAAQLWKKVMLPMHAGLQDKGFPQPQVGGDTMIFGNLLEEWEIQEGIAPPTPTPDSVTIDEEYEEPEATDNAA